MLSAVALTLAVAAAAPSAQAVDTVDNKAPVVAVEDAGAEEAGFLELYFPFMPDAFMDQAPLEPEMQENFWLVAILSMGNIPGAFIAKFVFLGEVEMHDDWMMELIIGDLIKIPFYWLFYFPGLYLSSLQGIHTFDRNIKKARGKPPAKWESSKNVNDLPGMPGVAAAAF